MAKRRPHKPRDPMEWFDHALEMFLEDVQDGMDDLYDAVEEAVIAKAQGKQPPMPPPKGKGKKGRATGSPFPNVPAKVNVMTWYDVLEVVPTASDDTIKAAYRSLSNRFHPDRNPGDKMAEERMKLVNQAWGVLGKPEKKAEYDKFLRSVGK